VHTEQTLSLEGGGVFVNSNNRTCALIQQANGSIRILGDFPIRLWAAITSLNPGC